MTITQLRSGDNEENASLYAVGKTNIVSIEEHRSAGEGDKWFYDVNYSGGVTIRIFNPLCVVFEK